MSKNSETVKKFAIGTAIAGAIGYLAGILTAPKSGAKTRKSIKKTADAGVGELEKQLKELHTEIDGLVNEVRMAGINETAKSKLDVAIESAKTTKNKLREVLSAVHEGEADNKDLDKAVKEAKKSIDHLKSFIKK